MQVETVSRHSVLRLNNKTERISNAERQATLTKKYFVYLTFLLVLGLCPSMMCNDPLDDDLRDVDEDGVDVSLDNCPMTPNPKQEDQDGDGMGDACDEPTAGSILDFLAD